MVKSRFKLFGTGLVIALFIFILCATPYLLIFHPHSKIANGKPDTAVFSFIVLFAMLVFIGYEIIKNLNIITINNDSITFQHLILRKESEIKFSELDGFTERTEISAAGSFPTIFLKKENEKIRKISSFYISNYAEIKNALQNNLKYLGWERSMFGNK